MLGRDGVSAASAWRPWLSSLSFPDMCSWLAAQLMLSRLACGDMSMGPIRLFGGDLDVIAEAAGE